MRSRKALFFMKVSVVVPVYNVEKYLCRCIDSLLNQSFSDFEIICVNDCSPDGSAEILKRYETANPERIKVLTNDKNLGLGLTRERALKHVRGEYVMFVDSDDYVKPDYIETYVGAVNEEDFDIVVGGYIRDCSGKFTEHIMSNTVWSLTTYAMACAKLYKTSFIRDNHLEFTDIGCGEDIYFSLSAFYCDPKFVVINYAGYYYFFNDHSITGAMDYSKNHERLMQGLFASFLENHDMLKLSQERQRVIEYTYIANMMNALIVFNRGCGISLMKEKHRFVMDDLESKFPNYATNPYIGLAKPKGQTLRVRLGVGIPMLLRKVHLDKPLFYFFALI